MDNEQKINLEHAMLDVGDVRLHVVQAGPRDGKPVILLHGFPDFWAGWENQIAPLASAGCRLILPDQRGYNLSDKPTGLSSYRLDALAKDVAGLMDALGYEKAALVGHDWGGVVAWAAAALYPLRIERLAVLDAPYPPVVFGSLLAQPRQLLKSSYMYFFQLPSLPEAALRRNNWQALAGNLRRTAPPGAFSEEDLARYRQAWNQPGAMTAMLNWYRALFRRPFGLPSRPHLPMPVLILWGSDDFALGRQLAERSRRVCAHAEMVIFEGANHWIQREKALEVNQLLINFCSKNDS
jgi:pimeloyl-ACP methyl ester carboxylesterase